MNANRDKAPCADAGADKDLDQELRDLDTVTQITLEDVQEGVFDCEGPVQEAVEDAVVIINPDPDSMESRG